MLSQNLKDPRNSNLRLRLSSAQGFTIVELVITLLIAGVLAFVAVPSLKKSLQGNRLTTATNRLVSSMHLARSEAVVRNSKVVICSNDSPATDWSSGWSVRSGEDCSTGELLKQVKTTQPDLAVTGEEIIFRGDGTATAAEFELVSASFVRQVSVKTSGHISTVSPETSSLTSSADDESSDGEQ